MNRRFLTYTVFLSLCISAQGSLSAISVRECDRRFSEAGGEQQRIVRCINELNSLLSEERGIALPILRDGIQHCKRAIASYEALLNDLTAFQKVHPRKAWLPEAIRRGRSGKESCEQYLEKLKDMLLEIEWDAMIGREVSKQRANFTQWVSLSHEKSKVVGSTQGELKLHAIEEMNDAVQRAVDAYAALDSFMRKIGSPRYREKHKALHTEIVTALSLQKKRLAEGSELLQRVRTSFSESDLFQGFTLAAKKDAECERTIHDGEALYRHLINIQSQYTTAIDTAKKILPYVTDEEKIERLQNAIAFAQKQIDRLTLEVEASKYVVLVQEGLHEIRRIVPSNELLTKESIEDKIAAGRKAIALYAKLDEELADGTDAVEKNASANLATTQAILDSLLTALQKEWHHYDWNVQLEKKKEERNKSIHPSIPADEWIALVNEKAERSEHLSVQEKLQTLSDLIVVLGKGIDEGESLLAYVKSIGDTEYQATLQAYADHLEQVTAKYRILQREKVKVYDSLKSSYFHEELLGAFKKAVESDVHLQRKIEHVDHALRSLFAIKELYETALSLNGYSLQIIDNAEWREILSGWQEFTEKQLIRIHAEIQLCSTFKHKEFFRFILQNGMGKVLDEVGMYIRLAQSGKEFYSQKVQEFDRLSKEDNNYFEKNGIQHLQSTYAINADVAERSIQQLERLERIARLDIQVKERCSKSRDEAMVLIDLANKHVENSENQPIESKLHSFELCLKALATAAEKQKDLQDFLEKVGDEAYRASITPLTQSVLQLKDTAEAFFKRKTELYEQLKKEFSSTKTVELFEKAREAEKHYFASTKDHHNGGKELLRIADTYKMSAEFCLQTAALSEGQEKKSSAELAAYLREEESRMRDAAVKLPLLQKQEKKELLEKIEMLEKVYAQGESPLNELYTTAEQIAEGYARLSEIDPKYEKAFVDAIRTLSSREQELEQIRFSSIAYQNGEDEVSVEAFIACAEDEAIVSRYVAIDSESGYLAANKWYRFLVTEIPASFDIIVRDGKKVIGKKKVLKTKLDSLGKDGEYVCFFPEKERGEPQVQVEFTSLDFGGNEKSLLVTVYSKKPSLELSLIDEKNEEQLFTFSGKTDEYFNGSTRYALLEKKEDSALSYEGEILLPKVTEIYPELESFVQQFKNDPIAIARFVQNEVAFVEPIHYAEGDIFEAPALVRNPLQAFVEKQGSPWEQCALLVYLLNRAGYPATFSTGGVSAVPRDVAENMLVEKLSDTAFLNYPWVYVYDGKEWISLFPWLKELQPEKRQNYFSNLPREIASIQQFLTKYTVGERVGTAVARSPIRTYIEYVKNALAEKGIIFTRQRPESHMVKRSLAAWDEFPRPYQFGSVIPQEIVDQVGSLEIVLTIDGTRVRLAAPIHEMTQYGALLSLCRSGIDGYGYKIVFKDTESPVIFTRGPESEIECEISCSIPVGVGAKKIAKTVKVERGSEAYLLFGTGVPKMAFSSKKISDGEKADEICAIGKKALAEWMDAAHEIEDFFALPNKQILGACIAKVLPLHSGEKARGEVIPFRVSYDCFSFDTEEATFSPIPAKQREIVKRKQSNELLIAEKSYIERAAAQSIVQNRVLGTTELLARVFSLQGEFDVKTQLSMREVLNRSRAHLDVEVEAHEKKTTVGKNYRDSLAMAFDSVDIISGEYMFEEVDIRLEGALPLQIGRVYHSGRSLKRDSAGFGWVSNLEVSYVEEDGIRVVRETDGSTISYRYSDEEKLWKLDPTDNLELYFSPDEQRHLSFMKDDVLYYLNGTYRAFKDGRVCSYGDAEGNRYEFTYTDGRLSKVVGTSGLEVLFFYTDLNLLNELVVSDGRRVSYTYSKEGNLTSVELPSQAVVSYNYDYLHKMTQKHVNGVCLEENRYDEKGRVVAVGKALGKGGSILLSGKLTYEQGITAVTDPYGNETKYMHHAGALLKSIDPYGNEVQKTYYGFGEEEGYPHMLKTLVDKRGLTHHYTYDQSGRCTGKQSITSDGAAHVQVFSYDEHGRIAEQQKGDVVTHYAYSGASLQYTSKNTYVAGALVNTVELDRDAHGRVLVEKNNGAITRYEYGKHGLPVRVIKETGTDDPVIIEQCTYAPSGNCVEVKKSDVTLSMEYDVVGNLLSKTESTKSGRVLNQTEYRYNTEGRCVFERGLQRDSEKYYYYTPYGLLRAVGVRTGNEIAYTAYGYNRSGLCVREITPSGLRCTREYDALGRVVAIAKGSEVSYRTYEAGDLVAQEVSAASGITSYEYTQRGELAKIVYPDGETSKFSYDDRGRVTCVENSSAREHSLLEGGVVFPAGVTRITYNDAEGALTAKYGERAFTKWFDLRGNLIKDCREDGSVALWKYDALGRLVESISPIGEVLRYSYDGDRITEKRENGEVAISRTENGVIVYNQVVSQNGTLLEEWLVSEDPYESSRQFQKGAEKEISLFDGRGLLISCENSYGKSTFSYNKAGECVSARNSIGKAVQYGYNEQGRLVSKLFGNGDSESWVYAPSGKITQYNTRSGALWKGSYDVVGRIVQEGVYNDGQVKSGFSYTYEHGVLSRVKDSLDSEYIYSYDSFGRVIRESVNGWYRSYTYDALGRVVEVEEYRPNTAWVFSNAQKTKVTRKYDAAGNIEAETVFLDGKELATTYVKRDRDSVTVETGEFVQRNTYENGKLVRVEIPQGDFEYAYALSGKLLHKKTPYGEVMYSYNDKGQLVAVRSYEEEIPLSVDAFGNVIRYGKLRAEYSENDVLSFFDGVTYAFSKGMYTSGHGAEVIDVDPFGRVTQEVVRGAVRELVYDDAGQCIAIGERQFYWDPWGRLVRVTDPAFEWEAIYDPFGRRLQVKMNKTIVTATYSPLSGYKPIGISTSNTTFWKVYAGDVCEGVIDRDAVALTQYDPFGRLEKVITDKGIQVPSEKVTPLGSTAVPARFARTGIEYALSLLWKGNEVDHIEFIYLDGKYYDPASGRFLFERPKLFSDREKASMGLALD